MNLGRVVGRRRLAVCGLELAFVLSAASLAGPRHASATVVAGVAFDAQCAEADRIFVGTVRSVESRRNPAAPAYFETIVTFTVDEAIVGAMSGEVALRFSGGQIGEVRQSIEGMPEFASGERYVVFAEPDQSPPLVSALVGFNQGLYSVVSVMRPDGPHAVVRDRLGRPLDLDRLPSGAAAVMRERTPTGEPEVASFVAAIRAVRPR